MDKCLQLYLELTDKCNMSCIHCYLAREESRTNEIPSSLAEKAIYQFKNMGGQFITFSGGETTLYKEWLELAGYAKKLDPDVTVMTNGIHISRYADRLRELGIKIGLSMDSVDKNTYEKIRKGGDLNILKRELEVLVKELNNLLIICFTPMKLNYHELPKLFHDMDFYGINNVYISILELRGRGLENVEELAMNDEEKVYFLNELYFLYKKEYRKNMNICISNFRGFMERLFNPNYGVSDYLDRTIRIDARGDIFLTAYLDDEEFHLGNLTEVDLSTIWYSDRVSTIYKTAQYEVKRRCGNCVWYSICQGGSAMLAYQKHQSFKYPDEWCNAKLTFLENYNRALS